MKRYRSLVAVLALTVAGDALAASGMSTYLQNKEVDAIVRNVAFTPATTLGIALYTACPTANNTTAAPGTEVSTTNTAYARGSLAGSTTNWASTGGATTTTNPSAGTTGTTSNNSAITTFGAGPTGIGLPVTVVCFGVFDQVAVGGNLYVWGSLTTNKTINSGDAVPTFAISALTIQLAQFFETHPFHALALALGIPPPAPVQLGDIDLETGEFIAYNME